MEMEIKTDPRYQRPFSLKFGLFELPPEEIALRKKNLLKNIGFFMIVTGTCAVISNFLL
jgi:hypothetical protein